MPTDKKTVLYHVKKADSYINLCKSREGYGKRVKRNTILAKFLIKQTLECFAKKDLWEHPFYQKLVSMNCLDAFIGHGLGLYICKKFGYKNILKHYRDYSVDEYMTVTIMTDFNRKEFQKRLYKASDCRNLSAFTRD